MFSSNTSQVSADANYIEDVFSTYLYTGNDTQRSIVNGIDLSTKGGMVWLKSRSAGSYNNHTVWDTSRGISKYIIPNATDAQASAIIGATNYGVNGFNTDGFSLGRNWFQENEPNITYASWTFREQAKFFDVVTYTGNGVARTISHNLGSVPGCIIIKDTSASRNWNVYHRSTGNTQRLLLNDMTAAISGTTEWNSTTPTATAFTVGTSAQVNQSGSTYVAYLFAHDAGGFGLTGTDNVITCGSFTSNASGNASISLGYEPQWILYKPSSSVGNWEIADVMRGWNNTNIVRLYPDSSAAEGGYTAQTPNTPTATGVTFTGVLNASSNYIYIAIRRGPMKVPTDATKVFSPVASSAATGTALTTNFPIDLQVQDYRLSPSSNFVDRLRGYSSTSTESGVYLRSVNTNAEASGSVARNWNNLGFEVTSGFGGASTAYYNFQRAPGFFDVVCYTGDGASSRTVNHNLAATPELIIVKTRSITNDWAVYSSALGATKNLFLNTSDCQQNGGWMWNNTAPTSTVFSVSAQFGSVTNGSSATYVAYLFATCPGVSKVGSYSGNSTSGRVIDCGFTGGARFVLIKQIDNVTGSGGTGNGNWYVWDSARGIVASNDPNLSLNSTAAELTNTDAIDTTSTGFIVNNVAVGGSGDSTGGYPNQSGYSYIFLAIA